MCTNLVNIIDLLPLNNTFSHSWYPRTIGDHYCPSVYSESSRFDTREAGALGFPYSVAAPRSNGGLSLPSNPASKFTPIKYYSTFTKISCLLVKVEYNNRNL